MTHPLRLSISSSVTQFQDSPSTKPFTLYNIAVQLPLRTIIVPKRYSEFVTLHSALLSAVSLPPPAPLPGKSWFKSTVSSPELTETRRQGLEKYIRAISEGTDSRWRDTSVWQNFLNLPNSSGNSTKNGYSATSQSSSNTGQLTADPAVWLDFHRDMKSQLNNARMFLSQRDGATALKSQYEAGVNAKKCLIKVTNLISNLEEGLKIISEMEKKGNSSMIGAGELRRRRDLLGSAKVELEGLEKLALSLASKSQSLSVSSGPSGPTGNLRENQSSIFGSGVSRSSGRVLGTQATETEKTRELDNNGVVSLQKKMMQDQDLDVDELAKVVRRQKEMGLAIQSELALQNEMMKRVDEDIDRVGAKINLARKRTTKIS
ncbi:hypothetical protein K3495_g9939 [Podosphaera aphanis]|nr:hypothetical protein K3495_g9939 [Podosphaera aphanis]